VVRGAHVVPHLVDDLLARIPLWSNAGRIRTEPLNGGLSNHTYKVTADGAAFVLRISGGQNDYLGLDRRQELLAINSAHALDVAPRGLWLSDDGNVLVTQFLPGRQVTSEEVCGPEMIRDLAGLMRRIHGITGVSRACGPYWLIHTYVESAVKLGVALPDGFGAHLARLGDIERDADNDGEWRKGYCHNDFFTINTIYHDGVVRMIDWELSGVGDIFFDLVALPYTCNFSSTQEKLLLESYFGTPDDEVARILQDMKFVALVREAAWALLHSAIIKDPVNHKTDYYGFAVHVTKRLSAGLTTLFD
jgi:thiamine kinase-like enzyme